ncbi:putative copia-type protein, partial [Trifolium pratense]
MHDPKDEHMNALKRIIRYVKGTLHLGLHLYPSSVADPVSYIDADWGGCPDTRRSTSG